MKLLYNLQKTLKNGLYIDYFFKNFIFYIYMKLISNNFLHLMDKYFAEKLFFMFKQTFQFIFFLNNYIKKMSILQIFKILILVVIQIIILIFI